MQTTMKDVTPKERVRVAAGSTPVIQSAIKETEGSHLPAPIAEQPTSFLAVIARAAADPRTDTAKMQALLAMQREIENRENEKAFTRDFIALQEVLPIINRDGKIEIRSKDASGSREHGKVQQTSPYSTYPNIMKVCKPLLNQFGFALSSKIRPGIDGKILVVTTLRHVEYHSDFSEFPLPAEVSGSKNNVQGWGSSQQYGMRYNAIALLNIVSEAPQDADKNGFDGKFQNAKGGGFVEENTVVKVSTAQVRELWSVLEECKVPEAQFLMHYGIKTVQELPVDLFEAAKKALRDHKAKREQPNG